MRVLQLLREQSQSPLAHWDGDLQAALSQAQSTVPASQQSLQLLQQLVAQGVQQARRQQQPMLAQLLRAWQPRERQPLALAFRLLSLQVAAAARSAQPQQARPVVLTGVDLRDAALQSESSQPELRHPELQNPDLQHPELQRLLAQQMQSQSLTFQQSLLAS